MSDYVYPCPCGNYGEPQKTYWCAPVVVTTYQKRISGPLLDRIDIHIEVPPDEWTAQQLREATCGGADRSI